MKELTLEKIKKMIEDNTINFIDDCTVDNYGTDGGTRYQQTALIDGTKIVILWDTTQEHDKFQAAYGQKMYLENENYWRDLTEEEEEFIKNYEEEFALQESIYLDDESNNCDWFEPVDFEIID